MKTICLNMIVKNESHIIQETLKNILDHIKIDYWVICDTGSTDTTKDIIQTFFDERNIKGELHNHEWVDFGTNRTRALQESYNKTDYLLIFDADDCFHGELILPDLVHDKYHLKIDNGRYYRPLLINNHKKWKFVGVLHEYLDKAEDFKDSDYYLLGNYDIQSRRLGSRNKDPEKYIKDAYVLEKAYEKAVKEQDPLANRYVFYCANSFKDAGKIQESLIWYKKTLQHTGWIQERYVSCLRIYECYEHLHQKEHGFFYLLKSIEYDTERLECLHKIISHYCCENQSKLAYSLYRLVKEDYETNYKNPKVSKLFLDTSIGDFYFPYIMIIVADRVNERQTGVKMYEIIFYKQYQASEWYLNNLAFNMKFFIQHFTSDTFNLLNDYKKNNPLFVELLKKHHS
jgi:hypothetical protein